MATTTKIKPYSKTKIVFALSLLGAVAAIAAYAYLFHYLTTLGENTASLQADTNALALQESQVDDLKKSLADNQAQEPILESYFIDANDIVPFLETIEGYGKTTDTDVKFNSVDLKPSPAQLDVSLSSNGSFTDLYHFLALLEAAPYEFTVTNATIDVGTPPSQDPNSKGPPPVVWEADVQLAVTSITGVQSPAPAAAPAATQ